MNPTLLANIGLAPAPLIFPVAPDLNTVDLRDYQEDILWRVSLAMQLGYRRILIVLPTGGGKTKMAAAMMQSAVAQALTAQFLVHRKELIRQTSKSFFAESVDHGFIASGWSIDTAAQVTLAGVQTLVNRLDIVLPPRLVIIDEAHHATAASWGRILAAYGTDSFIVGLTATPQRLDGRGLNEHFDIMVEGPTVAELIEWGYLSPFDYYAPDVPDVSGLKTQMGDFDQKAASELVDKPKLIGDVAEHYLRHARGEQGIVFASSIAHSKRLADAFRGEGVRAVHVDGTMDDERDRAMEMFEGGDIDVLMNVDLFDEGVDVPGIVYLGIHRITKSLVKHRQQCGRVLRTIRSRPDKVAVINDHAGNALRGLGLPDADVIWSLEGQVKGATSSGGGGAGDATAIHQCKACFLVVPSSVVVCPRCSTAFEVKVRGPREAAGKLSKVEKAALLAQRQKQRLAEERACRSYKELYRLGVARGYKNPAWWAQQRGKYIMHGPRT